MLVRLYYTGFPPVIYDALSWRTVRPSWLGALAPSLANDPDFKANIKEDGNYKRTVEKSHSQIEIREYYQTDDIQWLSNKNKWKNIKSIGIVEKTIQKKDKETKEIRYYISSLSPKIDLFEKVVRGHWAIEIMHWHLDVTFKEDSNKH